MGDKSKRTPERDAVSVPLPTTRPKGVGADVLDLQDVGGGGNAAALEACGWRESGNLIGNPPVRDPCSPPNIGIEEDQAIYSKRRAAAQATLGLQRARADSFMTDGEVSDHRYWFAKVYSYVTEGELAEAGAGTFYYPSYVMESVRYFDKIYADNAATWDKGGTVEDHWGEAFQLASDSNALTWTEILASVGGGGIAGGAMAVATAANPIAMVGGAVAGALAGDALSDMYIAASNLVASMKAHIRYDLPRAGAWVFGTHNAGMQDASMGDFQADFNNMGPVFDQAAVRMNGVIGDLTGVPVTWMPQLAQDLGMTYWFGADMATERADTWQRAEALVNGGEAGNGPYADTGAGLAGDTTASDNMSFLDMLPAELRPDMDAAAPVINDDQVRADVVADGEAGLAARPTSDRIRMVRGALRGMTLDGDEQAVLSILAASIKAGDIETVIGGANPWELMSNTHGGEFTALMVIMRQHYFASCPMSSALTLIQRAIGGRTSDWQQGVIADLVCSRADGHALIEAVGAGDFTEGLNTLEWQLSGAHQGRVEAEFGVSGTFW